MGHELVGKSRGAFRAGRTRRRLSEVNITRHVGLVALGTALGQGSIVLVTPFLARIYTPAEFGELALYLTVATYAAAAGCLRYDVALAAAPKAAASALLWLCMVSALGTCAVALAVAMLPWHTWTDSMLATVTERPWLLALTVLAVALYQAVSSEFVRAGEFARLAWLRGSQGVLFAGAALFSVVGLVVAVPASFAAAASLTYRRVARTSLREIVEAARQYRSYPLLSLPGALFDVIACSAAVLVISASYGISEVGHFSQVQRFVGAPLLLVSASLFQVFLRQSADQHQAGRSLMPLLVQVGSRVAGLIAGVMVAVVALGEPLLSLLLGAEWRVDRYFLATVVGALAVRVCVSPFSSVLFTTGRLRNLFAWQFAYFVSAFTVLPLAASRLEFDHFLAIYLLHETVLYALYMALIVNAARGRKN